MKGLTAVIGIIGGFVLMIWSISIVGDISPYFKFAGGGSSVIIVFGGTLAAALTSFTISQFLKGLVSLKDVIFPPKFPYSETIVQFRQMADDFRREGTIGLQRYEDEASDDLMRFGIIQILSGASTSDELRSRILPKLETIREASKSNQEVFSKMGSYAPAFGMAGTLIGLIAMLATLKDPSGIGPKMSTALITTLFGVLTANLVFLPLSSRIAKNTEAELQYKELIVSGLLALFEASTGDDLVDRLMAYVPQEEEVNISSQA